VRRLFAVVLGAGALALAGAARGTVPPPLATPWPSKAGCSSFDGADISVDDRVGAVEWRGPNGASLAFDLKSATDEHGREEYALGSEGLDCHRELTSCIAYRRPAKVRYVHVARGRRPLPPDFAPGAYTELVLRDDVRGSPLPRADRELEFGLRLILRCADSAKTSLAWHCDAKACVPRTFRDNVKVEELRRRDRRYEVPVDGPYSRKWTNYRADALAMNICFERLPGFAAANREARRVWNDVACTRGTESAADPNPRILELARDLLAEVDLAAELGCAGACSARVDELRVVARALGAEPRLHVTSARAVFDGGDRDDPGYGAFPSLGWIAKLAAPSGAAEIACAHHQNIGVMSIPDVQVCRVSVFARGRRLGDYVPGWRPKLELPDGGAVHLLDAAERANERSGHEPGDQITVIGSALAQ
jgi:hypothetical protein